MNPRSRTAILGEPKPWEPHYRFGRLLRVTVGKVLLALWRVRVIDYDRIPLQGAALLAGNHVSYADPALLWCVTPRPVHFMAKSELFGAWPLSWALPRVWAFSVRRGEADRGAISMATEYLKAGDLVGMFPEGTRNRSDADLGAAHQGVAFVAVRAGVPVIPVGIAGTDRIKPEGARMIRFPRVTMCVGEPVDPADYAHLDKRERLAAMTTEIMSRISAELERARSV